MAGCFKRRSGSIDDRPLLAAAPASPPTKKPAAAWPGGQHMHFPQSANNPMAILPVLQEGLEGSVSIRPEGALRSECLTTPIDPERTFSSCTLNVGIGPSYRVHQLYHEAANVR